MSYDPALKRAWLQLSSLKKSRSVRFLNEEFLVEPDSRQVLSGSGIPAKDFISILILHYLAVREQGLPGLTGRWLSFQELDGGEQYYPAFRKRSLDIILSAGDKVFESLAHTEKRGMSVSRGDANVSVRFDAFEGVPVQVVLWKGDTEFPAEASMLFDSSIRAIFCTEDVAVLAGFAAKFVCS